MVKGVKVNLNAGQGFGPLMSRREGIDEINGKVCGTPDHLGSGGVEDDVQATPIGAWSYLDPSERFPDLGHHLPDCRLDQGGKPVLDGPCQDRQ